MDNCKRQTITPSITVGSAEAAVAFYEKVFGAKVDGHIMRGPDGAVMHAELLFGDMRIYVNDEFPEMGASSPEHYGGSPISLQLMVENVDKTYEDAIAAGATSKLPPCDAFWGDRYAYVEDPFGHSWGLASPKELLTPEQMEDRWKIVK